MKSCPTCKRTYSDDTLTFCLDDGTRLSASSDPHATLRVAPGRDTDPPRTEILPAEHIPVRPQQETLRANIPPSMPLTNTAQAPENHVSEKSSAKHWVIISGALALVVIVLASVLGYLAWKGNNRSAGESSGVSSNTQTNNNVPTKGDSEAAAKTQPSESTSFQWLDGVWEGKGYQSNTKSTWTIRLTVQNGTYVIEYPSIPCSGRWTLIKQDTVEATFNERITQGLNRCVENGSVVIEKIDDSQVSCKYSAPPAKGVIATAILRKTAQSPEQK